MNSPRFAAKTHGLVADVAECGVVVVDAAVDDSSAMVVEG